MTSTESGPADIQQIRNEIDADRERLATTVDALSQRLDVKARTRARLDQVKDQATHQFASVRTRSTEQVNRLKDSATTPDGRPTPQASAVAGITVLATALVLVLIWRREYPRARDRSRT